MPKKNEFPSLEKELKYLTNPPPISLGTGKKTFSLTRDITFKPTSSKYN